MTTKADLTRHLMHNPDDLTYAYWGYRADQPDGFEFGNHTLRTMFPEKCDVYPTFVVEVIRSTFKACITTLAMTTEYPGDFESLLDRIQQELDDLCEKWNDPEGMEPKEWFTLAAHGATWVTVLSAYGRLTSDNSNGTQYGFSLNKLMGA